MNVFVFLGIFLIVCSAMVIFSTLKGSGKAGVAKVEAELVQTVHSDTGRFLYTEYEFTFEGEEIRVKCPNKTKTPVGGKETMYYDITKDVLSSESSRRTVLIIAAICIVLGILSLYFRVPLTNIFG